MGKKQSADERVMTYEDVADKSDKRSVKRTLMKNVTSFDDMDDYEVFRRMYLRHAVGVWQTLCGIFLIVIILIVIT